MYTPRFSKNKKTATGYTMIIVGITALLCIALFLFLGYRFWLKPEVADVQAVGGIQFEEDQFREEVQIQTENIAIPGFNTWTVSAGTTKAETHFYNPESNNCYFVLTVTLDESGETIYESKYLKPGQHLYNVELLNPLTAGTYKATLHYSTFTMDEAMTPLNGAAVPFELVVK